MLVGHDPGIPELAVTLAAAVPPTHADSGDGTGPSAMTSRMRAKFPTAAIAVFEYAGAWDRFGPGLARLADFITPRELTAGPRFAGRAGATHDGAGVHAKITYS